jgi:hypothetical protein
VPGHHLRQQSRLPDLTMVRPSRQRIGAECDFALILDGVLVMYQAAPVDRVSVGPRCEAMLILDAPALEDDVAESG